MKQTDYLFTIAHQLKNRLRIIIPSLHKDYERVTVLKILLLKRGAINEVKTTTKINSITIYFDSEQLEVDNLLTLLNSVLENFPKNPKETIKSNRESNQALKKEQTITFGVKGMSCESCALFLEMVLSKKTKKKNISINYKSEQGVVRSYLSQTEIFEIIEKNGYQPYFLESEEEKQLLKNYQKKSNLLNQKTLFMSLSIIVVFLIIRNKR